MGDTIYEDQFFYSFFHRRMSCHPRRARQVGQFWVAMMELSPLSLACQAEVTGYFVMLHRQMMGIELTAVLMVR